MPPRPSAARRLTEWLAPTSRDPRTTAARRAGLFFLVGGACALLGSLLPHPVPGVRGAAAALGVVDLLVGWALYRLPWHRWREHWTLVVVPVAFAVMWAFHTISALAPAVFAAFMILVLFWVGLSHRPGTATLLSPIFGLAYFWPSGTDLAAVHSTLVVLPVAVLIAESTAFTLRALRDLHAREQRRSQLYLGLAGAMKRLSALEWDKACDEVVLATIHLGFEGASLNLIDPEQGTYRLVRVQGLPESLEGMEVELDVGVTGAVARSADLVVIEDYARDPRAIPALRAAGFTKAVGAPVVIGGRVHAVLVGLGRTGARLDDDEKRVFRLLADQAAIALANASSHRSVRDRADRYREDAERDALTGIGNRRFGERLLEDLRAGDGVMVVDLDHFKRINDTLGHAAGDQLLSRFGEFLKSTLRDHDSAARWGGEEFLVVLPGVDGDLAVAADRLIRAWRSCEPQATFSAGAALHAANAGGRQTLALADTALYEAKRGGRDQVRIASPAGSAACVPAALREPAPSSVPRAAQDPLP